MELWIFEATQINVNFLQWKTKKVWEVNTQEYCIFWFKNNWKIYQGWVRDLMQKNSNNITTKNE